MFHVLFGGVRVAVRNGGGCLEVSQLFGAPPFDTTMGLVEADLGPGVYASEILWMNS